MSRLTIVDGNNLLHAMHACVIGPAIGRHHLAVLLDRLARRADERVIVVFDGPTPRNGLKRQFSLLDIEVRFSESVTADEVILRLMKEVPSRVAARLISSDRQLRFAALEQRFESVTSETFAGELVGFQSPSGPSKPPPFPNHSRPSTPENEKPDDVSSAEAEYWLKEMFGDDEDDGLPPLWQMF